MKVLKPVQMHNVALLENPDYSPEDLLSSLEERFNLKNDAHLARALRVAPPYISKIRNRHLPVSDAFLIRLHDATGLPINELRSMMGVQPVVTPLLQQAA